MPSDDIARLYNFVANTTIQSAQANAELNQLITSLNSKMGRGVSNTLTGNNTFSGQTTFSGIPTVSEATTGLKTDKVSEYTAAAGVTIDSVLCKDGMVTVSGTPTTGGQIGYASNVLTFHNGSGVKTLMTIDGAGYPKGYLNGPAPLYASAATITLKAGLRARNSANTADIEVASDITLSLATSGAAGLDTGSEASSTWYYVYLIRKSSDGTVSAVFSTTNETVSGSITYPSGYDQKRQLPLAVRNDGSSNILPFYITDWGYNPTIYYNVDFPASSTDTNATTRILDNGAAATFTSVSAASFVPPLSTIAILHTAQATSGTITYFRAAGSSLTNGVPVRGYDEDVYTHVVVPASTAQAIEYKTTSTRVDVCIKGFTINTGAF